MRRIHGFTLIELLVVVAIIAILAAIAVPNFLEAQVRSRISRSLADMRIIVTALESYHVDNRKYPSHELFPAIRRLNVLTTPIAYITSLPHDPFSDEYKDPLTWLYHKDGYIYDQLDPLMKMKHWDPMLNVDWDMPTYVEAYKKGREWLLAGRGPNAVYDPLFFGDQLMDTRYDPTNGTVSRGDLERFGP